MINTLKSIDWVRLTRAHACTLSLALSLNATWRVPRDALRHGAVSFGLAHTASMLAVALPATTLQLAVGQLSQQDVVGMWKAVPFFKGIGYLRLLITLLGSVLTSIYLAFTVTYFIYILSTLVPSYDCYPSELTNEQYDTTVYNTSVCKNVTLTPPVTEEIETYLGVAFIIVALWIAFPFMLYKPVKWMKRIFYTLGLIILVSAIIIVSCIGDRTYFLTFHDSGEWRNLLDSKIWCAALTQALWSSQIANGFVITVSDAVYSNIDVEWTAIVLIVTNLAFSWMGSMFWFSIAGGHVKDSSAFAVLIQMFNVFEEKSLQIIWPLLTYTVLCLSGVISMVTLLIPVYVHVRNVGAERWRVTSFVISLTCAALSLTALAIRIPALDLLEDICMPLVVSLATILEILVFVIIYGWKLLSQDVAFLTARPLSKIWMVGWCLAPGISTAILAWWLVVTAMKVSWTMPLYEVIALTITAAVALLVILVSASFAVVKQVQYDFFGKLKSSFKPSRHWGPRDPITHYYWLARREEAAEGTMPYIYHRWQLGQMTSGPRFLHIPKMTSLKKNNFNFAADKKRANSDDFIYTTYRRQYLEKAFEDFLDESKRRRRSKSLEYAIVSKTNRKITFRE